MWFLLPTDYKEHIAKITDVENYKEGEGGSIGARLVMWQTAVGMIERRPGLGFGYGFENFVSAAQADHPDKPDFFEDAAHAHNMWLETAAENGIAGAVLLLAFTVVRIAGLGRAWWRLMRRRHGFAWLLLLWLCLEVTVQVYGLTNYALRRNLGFLTYWIWAGSVVLVVVSARPEAFTKRREPMELPKF
jgi:O-antigen ligase